MGSRASLGLSELLPHERVFVGVTSTQPAWGGFHCPNPVPGGLPSGYRYVQAAAVITRYGDLHGEVPSAPGVAGLDLIRNLCIIMEGAFDREAAAVVRIGGPESGELHDLLIRATLDGNLSPLQSWLEDRYGPGEFTALFRSDAYSRAT